MNNKNDFEKLYNNLVCALTHNIDTCDRCKKCPGKDGVDIRLNMVKELAYLWGLDVPWKEEDGREKKKNNV